MNRNIFKARFYYCLITLEEIKDKKSQGDFFKFLDHLSLGALCKPLHLFLFQSPYLQDKNYNSTCPKVTGKNKRANTPKAPRTVLDIQHANLKTLVISMKVVFGRPFSSPLNVGFFYLLLLVSS